MTTLRIALLVVPGAIVLALLQAFLWIPTYETQGEANPGRLDTFVEASIGDARLLNPILNADTASARIAELVFDGLLRPGADLELEGALAERWRLTETARLAVKDEATARDLRPRVEGALRGHEPGLLLEPVAVLSPGRREAALTSTGGETHRVTVQVPARLELRLARVVPELEAVLREALGAAYGADHDPRTLVSGAAAAQASAEDLAALAPLLEHNPEITFWLRRDVRFHDGEPFGADDVVFTFEAIMEPRNLSPRRSSFEPVKSVIALDEHTVRVVYKRLFSPAVEAWTIGMLPRHRLDAAAMKAEMERRSVDAAARERFGMRDSEFNRNPVGTGAFRFRRWSSDELIHLSRNPGHWDGSPRYSEYYYRVIPDTLTQEIEFRAGAVDTYQAEPHQAARYRADRRYRAFSSVVPGYTYIGYNLRRAPFDDPVVRRALGMAIDVDAIIRYTLFGEAERVTGPFASITRWYDRSVPTLPHDPEAARALLESRGWHPGADGWLERDGKRLEFNLITNNGNLRRKAVASIVQQAWQRIGVKCNVQLFEWAVFLKDFVNPGSFDAVVLGWRLGLDPDLHQIWHSSQTGPNELNFVGFADTEADRLIDAIRREYDGDAQRDLAHRLHRRIADLQPYTFLFAPRATRLLDRKIVMIDAAGHPQPVRAGGAGDLFFYFNRWQRLARDPEF
jgi:ABC-type transport system substrate-binding protein